MRPVTVQRAWRDLAVIASGLKRGEMVVTDGQLRLSPGARAVIRNAAGSGPNSAGAPRGSTGGSTGGSPGGAGSGAGTTGTGQRAAETSGASGSAQGAGR